MHFYTQQHQYYCGIDLHTKNMYVCILNQVGNILFHKNIFSFHQSECYNSSFGVMERPVAAR